MFKRMADAGNTSVSRCMGDWLTDTMEAAEMITLKMEDAKRAPMRVIKEMRAMVAGMVGSVDELEDIVRTERRTARAEGTQVHSARAGQSDSGLLPPSSNTGVLVPSSPVGRRRLKRTVREA